MLGVPILERFQVQSVWELLKGRERLMRDENSEVESPLPGSARLSVVFPAAVAGFLYVAMLEYSLPLYISALRESNPQVYEHVTWEMVMKFQIIPFAVAPILAGVLARRYGERRVWCFALLGKVIIPPILALHPHANLLSLLAMWQGLTTALIWTSGLSLSQMVSPSRKGRANATMLMALGLGSLIGPIVGRYLLHRAELNELILSGGWLEALKLMFNLARPITAPVLQNFNEIFLVLTITTFVSSIAIGLWAQHAGRFSADQAVTGWGHVVGDLGRLVTNRRFWAIVICLCILGAPCIHASNQYLPRRADVLGLKKGSSDTGWIWLNLLKTIMWLPGGAAVGMLAGRRASGRAAVTIACVFAVATVACGYSRTSAELFAAVIAFEFLRQFMRWLFTGYLSEHMPSDLRSTAIGLSVTFAGLSSTIYAWWADWLWKTGNVPADFRYDTPFLAAAILGVIGALLLAVYDRFDPIRERQSPAPVAT
ncbi:MAG: MFS transporter [Planctomycetota bacterium]|nr:MFS transporter [Planctomycetota bacterium]MDA1178017.1 MFS transporter [Planctomycetota bacterium]